MLPLAFLFRLFVAVWRTGVRGLNDFNVWTPVCGHESSTLGRGKKGWAFLCFWNHELGRHFCMACYIAGGLAGVHGGYFFVMLQV